MTGKNKQKVREIVKSLIINSPQMLYVSIGGTADHIHVLLYSKSTISVAQIAQKLKGTSSDLIKKNKLFPFRFAWQHEYGCVTVDKGNLESVKHYIKAQEEYHTNFNLNLHLECCDFRDLNQEHAWGSTEYE